MHGATMVEYALIMSSLVVVSLGAVQFLQDRATDESLNQADCIAERPPTASCQIRAITTTSTPSTVVTTATTGGTGTAPSTGSTTTTTTIPPPDPNLAVWDDPSPNWSGDADPPLSQSTTGPGGSWDATAIIGVRSPTDDPAVGVQVRVKWTAPGLPLPQYQTCTTGADGSCTFTFTLDSSVTSALATVVQIISDPPVDSIPGPLPFVKP